MNIEKIISLETPPHFPRWEDFPEVDLYMDQVTDLINRQLGSFSLFKGGELCITSSMINNYVKSKLMPPPVKKRYSRIHLAYIVIICTLKQTFCISAIQNVLRPDIPEDGIKKLYNEFALAQEEAYLDAATKIKGIFAEEDSNSALLTLNMMSNVNTEKILAEKISAELLNKVSILPQKGSKNS